MNEKIEIKHQGKVYTPRWIAEIMINQFSNTDLKNARIMDPGVGSGNLLVPLARRLALKFRETRDKGYLKSLSELHAIDIDGDALQVLHDRLKQSIRQLLPTYTFDFSKHILHANILDQLRGQKENSFDVVISNPPYVKYSNIPLEDKSKILAAKFKLFTRQSDLYIAFFEFAINSLKVGGKLSFITPSSWLRSAYGLDLRNYLMKAPTQFSKGNLLALYDFADHQVFEKAITYPAICCIKKIKYDQKRETPKVYLYDGKSFSQKNCLGIDGGKWFINSKPNVLKISNYKVNDLFDIVSGIETSANSIFITKKSRDADNNCRECVFNGRTFLIEKPLLKKILKLSVLKDGKDTHDRFIIYPHDRDGNLLEESFLREKYPKGYEYLLLNKRILEQRYKGIISEKDWYTINPIKTLKFYNGPQVVTPEMAKYPKFQIVDLTDSLFTSGSLILARMPFPLEKILSIFNTDRMAEYIKETSQIFRESYYRYSKRYLGNYPIG